MFERRDLRINECNYLFQSHAGIISPRKQAASSLIPFSRAPAHGYVLQDFKTARSAPLNLSGGVAGSSSRWGG